jgi:hypothetical protein
MKKRRRNVILNEACAVTFFAVALCACTNAEAPQRSQKDRIEAPVTVCEVLKDPPRYRGKLVRVTGVYWNGLRESCREPLVTGNHTWPSALNLADTDFPASANETVSFRTDQKSWKDLEEIVLREAKAGQHEEICVTLVGVLRAPQSYIRENGQIVGGYGHLGVFPAELVVERVSGVTIKSNPTYDYGELVRRPRSQ